MPHAYVDGSYNVATKRFGYGIVLFTDAINPDGTPQEIRLSKSFSHEELAEMRNIAGDKKRKRTDSGHDDPGERHGHEALL